jgi:hypothetical protein
MTTNLEFNKTQTLDEFKAENNINGKIDIGKSEKNPSTGKCFLFNGKILGAVAASCSENGYRWKKPMVSNVTGSDGKQFLLLHETPTNIKITDSL